MTADLRPLGWTLYLQDWTDHAFGDPSPPAREEHFRSEPEALTRKAALRAQYPDPNTVLICVTADDAPRAKRTSERRCATSPGNGGALMSTSAASLLDFTRTPPFLDAIFRYANPETWIALRVFKHEPDQPPPWSVDVVAGDHKGLLKTIECGAQYAATATDPCVFSPAMATFARPGTARTHDIAEGVALIIELDEVDTSAALNRIEALIGHATVVIRSGGEWTDPETGEVHPKLHAYWRLSEPTGTEAEHVQLYAARRDAALLTGADPSGKPVVHCYRWPGSLNRKNPDRPVTCTIERIDPEREIHLMDAAELLAEAVEGSGAGTKCTGNGHSYIGKRELVADPALVAAAMATIPNPDVHYGEWIRQGYAVCGATGGNGYDIFCAWSQKSAKHDDGNTEATWKRIVAARVSRIGAGSIFAEAKRHGWIDPRAKRDEGRQRSTVPVQTHTMISLKGKQFVPLQWVVPDYIPEGVTLLAGKPKIGKSWLVLGIALGVARGTEALDKPIKQREVLYCALEDNERRMQARTATIMGPCQDWPANMHVTYELRPIDAGGLEDLEWWVHTHPATGLIMIDTLAKVRGIKRRDEEPYQYDYRVIGMVQEFARQHRIAIVIVHHVRKSAAEDVLDTVSGTTGIAGAADTVIVLGQTEKGARLYLRGRDCEEQDKLVDLDPDTGIWEVLSDYDETDEEVIGARKQIVTLLRSTARPMTPKEIGARLGITPLNTRQHLSRMRRAGLIRRTDYGLYEPAATA